MKYNVQCQDCLAKMSWTHPIEYCVFCHSAHLRKMTENEEFEYSDEETEAMRRHGQQRENAV